MKGKYRALQVQVCLDESRSVIDQKVIDYD